MFTQRLAGRVITRNGWYSARATKHLQHQSLWADDRKLAGIVYGRQPREYANSYASGEKAAFESEHARTHAFVRSRDCFKGEGVFFFTRGKSTSSNASDEVIEHLEDVTTPCS